MLAVAQPSQARIVYTHAHKAVGEGLTIDLNHDGIADFKIERPAYSHFFWLVAVSLGSNRVWGGAKPSFLAAELPAGYRIRPDAAKFHIGGTIGTSNIKPAKALYGCSVNSGGTSCSGSWSKATSGYLGLEFLIKGNVHFGWARLSYSPKLPGTWFLDGYAYETTPGKSIVAGKTKGPDNSRIEASNASVTAPSRGTATLGMLALGAPALSIWRREESAAQKSQAT
jgi:hypothetical protein